MVNIHGDVQLDLVLKNQNGVFEKVLLEKSLKLAFVNQYEPCTVDVNPWLDIGTNKNIVWLPGKTLWANAIYNKNISKGDLIILCSEQKK